MWTAMIIYLSVNGAILLFFPIYGDIFIDNIDEAKDNGVSLKHVVITAIFLPTIIVLSLIIGSMYAVEKVSKELL